MTENKKRILHLLQAEKFTYGYVTFMSEEMREYDHHIAILFKSEYDQRVESFQTVEFIERITLSTMWYIYKLSKQYDIVVWSGIWGTLFIGMINLFPRKFFSKLYLHFWGGDFYDIRKEYINSLGDSIRSFMKRKLFQKCAGVLFLIEGEYDEFVNISGVNKEKNYVATMPGNERGLASMMAFYKDAEDHFEIWNKEADACMNIIVGHASATEAHHIKVFHTLERIKDENIRIYCPLSYGDKEYRDRVIFTGNEMFGEKFIALTDFMSIEEYRRFMLKMHIGIFDYDRQQAMGNIGMVIRGGGKVYLKKDTTIWKKYHDNLKLNLYDINLLKSESYDSVIHFTKEDAIDNMLKMREMDSSFFEQTKREWQFFLKDVLNKEG